jgi:hypothetical protein
MPLAAKGFDFQGRHVARGDRVADHEGAGRRRPQSTPRCGGAADRRN